MARTAEEIALEMREFQSAKLRLAIFAMPFCLPAIVVSFWSLAFGFDWLELKIFLVVIGLLFLATPIVWRIKSIDRQTEALFRELRRLSSAEFEKDKP